MSTCVAISTNLYIVLVSRRILEISSRNEKKDGNWDLGQVWRNSSPSKKVLGIFCVIFQTKRLHLKHFPCFTLFEYLVQPEKYPSV